MWSQWGLDTSWIAFAQSGDESNTQSLIANLNVFLKVIYVIMRPLLVVAGMAMDNSLVLGQVFHLDRPLRQFRRIMTNFANFALGFIVLFYILKYVVGVKDESSEVFGIIKKALIAGIGIQASRFIMLAMLDISNIAIYSIGSIPTNVLETDATLKGKRVLKTHSTIDYAKFNTTGTWWLDQSFDIYYGCEDGDRWKHCTFSSGYAFNTDITQPYCVLWGMYAKNNILNLPYDGWKIPYLSLFDDGNDGPPGFSPLDDGLFATGQWWSGLNRDDNELYATTVEEKCDSLGDVIDWSKWFVWPLVTIYSSILDFASINLTDTQKTTGWVMIVFLLKTLIALALLIPMFMLCAVLIVRVGYLWFYIAFLPIYVIKRAFWLDFDILWKDRDSISWLVSAIFMPVIVVFALSMSLVFLTLTTEVMSPANVEESEKFRWAFDIEKIDEANVTIYKLPPTNNELHFKKPDKFYGGSMFRDFFAYIFINLVAIGMMWMLYFTALKSRSAMKEKVWAREKQAKSFATSLPVVPVPGWWKVGLWTAFNANPNDRRWLLWTAVGGYQDKLLREENAAISEMTSDKKVDENEKEATYNHFWQTKWATLNDSARAGVAKDGDIASKKTDFLAQSDLASEIAQLVNDDEIKVRWADGEIRTISYDNGEKETAINNVLGEIEEYGELWLPRGAERRTKRNSNWWSTILSEKAVEIAGKYYVLDGKELVETTDQAKIVDVKKRKGPVSSSTKLSEMSKEKMTESLGKKKSLDEVNKAINDEIESLGEDEEKIKKLKEKIDKLEIEVEEWGKKKKYVGGADGKFVEATASEVTENAEKIVEDAAAEKKDPQIEEKNKEEPAVKESDKSNVEDASEGAAWNADPKPEGDKNENN